MATMLAQRKPIARAWDLLLAQLTSQPASVLAFPLSIDLQT